MEAREIKLRFAGKCKSCGAGVDKGETAWHFQDEKKVECLECHGPRGPAEGAIGAPAVQVGLNTTTTVELAEQPRPGESARREYRRRSQKRQDELQHRWGQKLGKLVWLLEDEKQSTAAWSKGAKGERKVGEFLEKELDGKRCELLHDRVIPGSRANIDHIAIGPAGVTVIDAKNMAGDVRAVTKGIGRRKHQQLMVDGRDRTNLIGRVNKQVAVVSALLEELEPRVDVPIRGCICWWNYQGLPLIGTNKISIEEVRVLNPRACAHHAGGEGPLSDVEISVVADYLDSRLRQA